MIWPVLLSLQPPLRGVLGAIIPSITQSPSSQFFQLLGTALADALEQRELRRHSQESLFSPSRWHLCVGCSGGRVLGVVQGTHMTCMHQYMSVHEFLGWHSAQALGVHTLAQFCSLSCACVTTHLCIGTCRGLAWADTHMCEAWSMHVCCACFHSAVFSHGVIACLICMLVIMLQCSHVFTSVRGMWGGAQLFYTWLRRVFVNAQSWSGHM